MNFYSGICNGSVRVVHKTALRAYYSNHKDEKI